VEVEALEQRELLQHRRPLAPESGLADTIAAVIVGDRRLHAWVPTAHVAGGEHTGMARPARIPDLLRAAEPVDGLGDEPVRPSLARRLDLLDAVAASPMCLAQKACV